MRVERSRVDGSGPVVCLVDNAGEPVAVVRGFLKHLEARGCSPNTVRAYAYDLLRFWRFLKAEGLAWDTFRSRDALGLLEHLRSSPSARSAQRLGVAVVDLVDDRPMRRLSGATVNRIIAAVSSFYEYVSLAGLVEGLNPIEKRAVSRGWRVPDRHRPFLDGISRQQPVRRGIRVRVAEHLPRPLADRDVERLLATLPRRRDQAMFLLMLDGGLRPGEVLGLHLEDVEYGRRRVTVRARDDHPKGVGEKSRRERVVDLHEERTLAAVSAYVVEERPSGAERRFIFLVDRGHRRREPLGYAALARLFQRRCDALGIWTPWVTPHALRHTHATRMWEGGMRELTLQKRLGHASPESTRVYTRVSDATVVKEYRQALGESAT